MNRSQKRSSTPDDYAANESGDYDNSSDASSIDTSQALEQNNVSDDMPTDTTWDDYISSGPAAPVSSSTAGPESDFTYQGETTDNLQDHLLWQANLTPFSDTDRTIAFAIIDAIEETGYLTQDCEDISTSDVRPRS